MDRVREWLSECTLFSDSSAAPGVQAPTWFVKCHGCAKSVTKRDAINNRAVIVLGRAYHRDHVSCIKCKISITEDYYRNTSSQDPVCIDCYSKQVNPPCGYCGLPVAERAVRIKGAFWHRECIKCSFCMNMIAGRVFEQAGRWYDEDCMRILMHGVKLSTSAESTKTTNTANTANAANTANTANTSNLI